MSWFDEFLASIANLNLTEEQIGQITEALPILALQQQMGQFAYQDKYLTYQTDYLDYLNKQVGLSTQQLNQAQQELDFKNGPYWDWYVEEYFPAQKEMSANELSMSNNNVDMSMNNVYQEQQRSKQAELATQMAYAQAFASNPTMRTGQTGDGRNVPGMLGYTLGYPS